MPQFDVTTLDITILVGYVVGSRIIFGWYFARKVKEGGSESYFLAGRTMAWPIIGLSFYVSNMSGSTFVGLPGSGYNDGIAVYSYEWLPIPILIFFVAFMLPFYMRSKVYTAPQFLETRFDQRSRLAFSGFLLFANIFIDAASALFAGGMVLQTLFPHISLWWTVFITASLAAGYIFFGGLGAVVLNDTLQAALILIGGTVICILTWQAIPSWEAVQQASPEHALKLFQPVTDEVLPWPGIITGVLIVGIYFWCTNQFMIQRALASKSLDHGRWGSLFAGLLKLPNLFILILPGVMATALYPNLERPDLVFPTLAFDLLPVGFRGFMLAALAAAILSSLESILNSASTLFTMDFVRTLRPHTSDTALVWTGRIATIGLMALAVIWTPQIARFPTLWQYLQSILSYVTPPIVAIFLLGIFWQRATNQAAIATLIGGVALGATGWAMNEILDIFEIQFLYASGIMFALSCLTMVVVSLLTPPPAPERVENTTWRPRIWRAETQELAAKPWYQNYRVLSVGLLALTAIMVIWWA